MYLSICLSIYLYYLCMHACIHAPISFNFLGFMSGFPSVTVILDNYFFQSATHAPCWRWYHHRVGQICPPTSLSLQALNQLWCFLGNTSPLKKKKKHGWWLQAAPQKSRDSRDFPKSAQVSISLRSAMCATRTHQNHPPEWPSWRCWATGRTDAIQISGLIYQKNHGQPESRKVKRTIKPLNFKYML